LRLKLSEAGREMDGFIVSPVCHCRPTWRGELERTLVAGFTVEQSNY
jgi:hypothetical protein